MHDGFYLRGNFGFGTSFGKLAFTESTNVDLSGQGLGIDLLVGGSPAPGFAVGGGVLGTLLFDAEFKRSTAKTNNDVQSVLLGVFVDGFPQKSGPWHVGALLGLASVSLGGDLNPGRAAGVGGAVWGGYDAWVGPDATIGGLLRFTASRTQGSSDGNELTASTGGLMLMVTAVYH